MTDTRPVVALAYLGNPHDHPLWQEVADELDRATSKFGRFNSGHEGWAVIQEEVDELWAEVKANRGDASAARREAIQIAAMALRYIIDVTGSTR